METGYNPGNGWHVYDMYWKRDYNDVVQVVIKIDDVTKAVWTNGSDPEGKLNLNNFGPHNIILNMAIGETRPEFNIFDNSKINLLSQTLMWVDNVTVEKRTF